MTTASAGGGQTDWPELERYAMRALAHYDRELAWAVDHRQPQWISFYVAAIARTELLQWWARYMIGMEPGQCQWPREK